MTKKSVFPKVKARADVAKKVSVDERIDREGDPCMEWVWIADAFQFVRRDGLVKYRPDQWKSLFGWILPVGNLLEDIWRDKIPMRKFKGLVYLPGAPEFPDGQGQYTRFRKHYNIWRPSGVVACEGDTKWFEDHLAYLLPNQIERDYFLDYLALLVQSPAEKILFAPLIYSAEEGIGKSAIGLLMERIIGARNVVRPSTDEVNDSYTIWQEGHQLAVIEELMTRGHLDLANRLKPVITEPDLRISEKFKTSYTIPNHLNLLAFTNHPDALKLENSDRRWMILECKAMPKNEAYYDDLFENHIKTDEGAAAVKQLLLDRLTFLNPKGRAPTTTAKTEMRLLGLKDSEAALREAFDENREPFDFDLVRLDDIVAAMPFKSQQRDDVRAIATRFLVKEIRARKHTRYTTTRGSKRPIITLWSVRNHTKWETAGAAVRVDAYNERQEAKRELDSEAA